MPKKKNNIQKKVEAFSYSKPVIGKRFSDIKKHFGEISSLLNEKKK